MSTVNSDGIQDPSIGRGRGKKITQANRNNTHEAKGHHKLKITKDTTPTRVARGRGWKRPDQAFYVPKALRKEQSSEDCRREHTNSKISKEDEIIFSDFDTQACCDQYTLANLHPAEENTTVTLTLCNETSFDGSRGNRTEQKLNCSSKLNMKSNPYTKDLSSSKVQGHFSVNEGDKQRAEISTNMLIADESYLQSSEKSLQDSGDKVEGKGNLQNEMGIEKIDLVHKCEWTDTCQSRPLVRTCVESENKQERYNSIESQYKTESITLEQQEVVSDSCQSRTAVGSISYDNTESVEQLSLEFQVLQENITTEQDNVIGDNTSLHLEKNSIKGALLEEEHGVMKIENKSEDKQTFVSDSSESLECKSEVKICEHDCCDLYPGDICKTASSKEIKQDNQTCVIDSCQSLESSTGVNTVQHDHYANLYPGDIINTSSSSKENKQGKETCVTASCQSLECSTGANTVQHDHYVNLYPGDIINTGSSSKEIKQDKETCVTASCQSLQYKKVSTGEDVKHGLHPVDLMCKTTSSKGDVLKVDSKSDKEPHYENCLPKETQSDCVLYTVVKEELDITSGVYSEHFNEREKELCCENDDIDEINSCANKELNFMAENGSCKDEILSEIVEEQIESHVHAVRREVRQEQSIESEKSVYERNASILDVGNNGKVKVDLDEGNIEKRANKEKKKSKSKKDEVGSKEEKKKRRGKKKESEEKDKEKNEKDGKLKKKGKKKEMEGSSGSKCGENKLTTNGENGEKNEKEIKQKNDDYDDESWESKFNEDGDCLDAGQLKELTELTGIKKPSKYKTQFDYYSLPVKDIMLDDDDSDYGHIVELYDFSPELKTQDLVQLLSSFKSQGYEIKWVDDTHALAVFSSDITEFHALMQSSGKLTRITAKQAIQMCSSPIMRLRPVNKGISASKAKARSCSDSLQPYKPRPQTSNLAAHRLVTGALGMRSTMSKEERAREREKLKEAKEQKRQEKQRKADIWGD